MAASSVRARLLNSQPDPQLTTHRTSSHNDARICLAALAAAVPVVPEKEVAACSPLGFVQGYRGSCPKSGQG